MSETAENDLPPSGGEPKIQGWLRVLAEKGELANDLVETCCAISREHERRNRLSWGGNWGHQEEEDADGSALDFILHLKEKPPGPIRTRRALEKEFGRFITRSQDRCSREVWDGVSAALHELARQGKAHRLTGKLGEDHRNETVYTAPSERAGDQFVDLPTLDERAEPIPHLSATRRVESTAEKNKPALCSPTEYRTLVLKVLEAAKDPACLGDIHKVVMDKIPMGRRILVATPGSEDSEDGEDSQAADRFPWTVDVKIWLDSETEARASRLWGNAAEASLIELLCGYLLPKWLGQEKSVLSDFGPPQRVHESVKELMTLMRAELPDPFDTDVPQVDSAGRQEELAEQFRASINRIASNIFSILEGKCSEKGENGSFPSSCSL